MNVYCRRCKGLIKEDSDFMTPEKFKWKNRIRCCPHCMRELSDKFSIKQVISKLEL